MDDLSCYDYQLPTELIAKHPRPRRDESRLLVVDRKTAELSHHSIRDLPGLLNSGDCLVLNDTRVIPARLLGKRATTGGQWEGLFLGTTVHGHWRLIGHCRGRLKPAEQIVIAPAHDPESGDRLLLRLLEYEPQSGIWIACPDSADDPLQLLQRFGTVPLPPYIRRTLATESDRERYQTTYSRRPGAVAAPTAGLHFTPQLRADAHQQGIGEAFVTLHVGIGTFRPISVEKLSEHRMHSEWCELSAETADLLNTTRQRDGRIVAVGTTSARTLETAARHGELQPWRGETDLFIRPPYEFRAVDGLLTNFHLPKSTLLVLVSALTGRELLRRAYESAIRQRYRFYSYGDAMLIL